MNKQYGPRASRARESLVVFAGPTLAPSPRARAMARRYRVRPPVKRHDVTKVVEAEDEPGVMVIVDGVFHDKLAVGHAEIRDAMARGWEVWGLSSMGAIRAREMAALGMHGFGRVFERFTGEADFQDDEVALLHEATPPYRAVSEPLVHLRTAIEYLVEQGIVGEADASAVVDDLKSRWFGERTIRGTLEALARRAPEAREAIRRELSDFHRFALKTRDLELFLERHPWSQQGGPYENAEEYVV
jgi:hypothetical protein